MLTNAKTIRDFKLNGIDGEVGSIKEFFFDDKFWTVRYLVVNTGGWLKRKQVLISPYFILNADHELEFLNINLNKSEIENSPAADTDKPVSRRFEEDYYKYYGAPVYWGGPSMWGSFPSILHDRERWKDIKAQDDSWDPNLRSTKDVSGHSIQAIDGELGHVDDFIIDDETWAIRYMVVDTKNWLPGKKILISPQWINKISWEDSKVFVNLSQEAIRHAPEYDEDERITREYESNLFQHYNLQEYWSEQAVSHEYSSSHKR